MRTDLIRHPSCNHSLSYTSHGRCYLHSPPEDRSRLLGCFDSLDLVADLQRHSDHGRQLTLILQAIARLLTRLKASSFGASYRHCLTQFVRAFQKFYDPQYLLKIVFRRSSSIFYGTCGSYA